MTTPGKRGSMFTLRATIPFVCYGVSRHQHHVSASVPDSQFWYSSKFSQKTCIISIEK